MRRLFILCSFLFINVFLYSQSFTTVTGTAITDGGGQVWSNMTIIANLIPPNGSSLGKLQNQGHAITDTPQYVLGDASGNFSIVLDDNSKITPGGSFWRLSICSNTSSSCSTLDIPVSGVSQNITSQVNASIVSPSPNATTTLTRGYNVNEVQGGNGAFFWRTTDNTLWGCQTTPNASCPPGWSQIASAVPLPSATAAGQILYAAGAGNTYNALTQGFVDVRFGIGGSGGVDCTDTTDSTAIFQAMINNASDYTRFFIPSNCTFKISAVSPGSYAIIIQQRVGLQFVSAGRNGNSCRSSQIGSNFSGIDYTSTYSAGNQVFYINHSQDLLFQNLTIRTSNGGADQVFNVDQVGVMNPINTRNDWEYVCIVNQGSPNPNFSGWALSLVSANNVENQHIYHGDVTCSGNLPTSATSNGYAVLIGASPNPKNIIVEDLRASNCSVDLYNQSSSDISLMYGLDSSAWVNYKTGAFNSMIMGFRSETATHSIVNTNGQPGPLTAVHNDFAAANGTIFDGTASGCGILNYFANSQDSPSTTTIDCGTATGSIIALNNRNFNMDPYIPFSFVIGYGFGSPAPKSTAGALTATDVNWLNFPLRLTPTGANVAGPPGLMFDTLKSGAWDHFNIQSVMQQSDSNVGLNINYLGTNTGYIGLGGNIPGLLVTPNSTLSNSIFSISPRGTPAATSYTYVIQPITITGHADCSAAVTVSNGAAVLNSTNFNVVIVYPYAGAVYYNVYRTASGGTPGSTGLIGKIIGYTNIGQNTGNNGFLTLADTGLTGDGTTCPVGNNTGNATFGRHLTQVATGNWAGTCAMSAGTSCTITLSAAFASTPGCVVTVQGASPIVGSCSVSGTTVTVTAGSANSATWAAMLFGNPN